MYVYIFSTTSVPYASCSEKYLKSYMQVKLQMHTKLHEEIPVKCLTLLKAGMSQQTSVELFNIAY
jgi:hypothetical protein